MLKVQKRHETCQKTKGLGNDVCFSLRSSRRLYTYISFNVIYCPGMRGIISSQGAGGKKGKNSFMIFFLTSINAPGCLHSTFMYHFSNLNKMHQGSFTHYIKTFLTIFDSHFHPM